MSVEREHPLVAAILPLVAAMGGEVIAADSREPSDIPIEWQGEVVVAVRLAPLHGALERLSDLVVRDPGLSPAQARGL